MDSRLRRSPPDRASAVPYGQAGENALRFPHLAHRSAAAHKLHSTPQQDRMNLISGNSEEIWRAYCYQGAISSGDQHAKQTAFKRAAEALVAAGRIDKWDPWVWLL